MTRSYQRGMTMWSAAFVIGTLGFFLFLLFKVIPPYLEDMKIKTALESLAKEANGGALSKADMITRLDKRFDIDMVTAVKPTQLALEKRGKKQVIRMSYENVVPLFYNVSLLLEFNHEHEVRSVD